MSARPLDPSCADCEALREEIAGYMGHRTDNVAGKLWAAQFMFGRFESDLYDLVGDVDRLSHDSYDESLEIWDAADDVRLSEKAQQLIRDAGFDRVCVNHGESTDKGRWQTHYSVRDKALPVRGWRCRYIYVSKQVEGTTNVIGDEYDPSYYEISFWPEGWNAPMCENWLSSGYMRIVPDPLENATTKADAQ